MTKAVKNKILYQLNFLKSLGYNFHSNLKFSDNNIDSNSLPNSIGELKNIVENCHLCELSKTRKNVLFGFGNIEAKLMFISDEPTKSEDELKSFFVGKNGELLKNMIENVLPLKKEDIYMTSLVKCRGSNGFERSEYNCCNSYLYKQIDLIKPDLIVTLGEKSFDYLCNDDSNFNQMRGKVTSFRNITLLPTFSLSFLIRNPSSKKEAFSDMLKIKSILELN